MLSQPGRKHREEARGGDQNQPRRTTTSPFFEGPADVADVSATSATSAGLFEEQGPRPRSLTPPLTPKQRSLLYRSRNSSPTEGIDSRRGQDEEPSLVLRVSLRRNIGADEIIFPSLIVPQVHERV